MSQLKTGAILSYFTIVLSNVIGLLLTPFIIKRLGDSQYGLYSLIGATVAYISILDFGLNNSIIRFISKYRAEGNSKEQENFLAITFRLYIIIALLVVTIGSVVYNNLDIIFWKSLSAQELPQAKIMFVLLIINLAITLPGGAYTAICTAYEHFVFPRLVGVVRYIIRSIAVVALLCWKGDAVLLVALDTTINILVILTVYIYTRVKLNVKPKMHHLSTAKVKEIVFFSFWVFIYSIVHQFQWNAGQLVLGINLDTISVGIFAVGVMLGGYYAAFGGVLNSLLIPKANQTIVAAHDGFSLTQIMVKYSRINAVVIVFVLCGFILFGREFIYLWVGENYALSYIVALLMMAGLSFLIIQGFGNSILEAKKKNRFKSILSFCTVALAVGIGYFLSQSYGILGVIIPLAIAMFVNGIVMNIYFVKIFDFRPILFYKESLLPVVVCNGILTLAFWFLKKNIIMDSWYSLIGVIVVFTSTYGLLTYFFILNTSEKQIVLNRLS